MNNSVTTSLTERTIALVDISLVCFNLSPLPFNFSMLTVLIGFYILKIKKGTTAV